MFISAQQGPASRSDVVARTAFEGLRVGFDGGIGFSLCSVHVTHQHPTFRSLVIDADAVLRCAKRVILQVQSMHGGRCRNPRLDVFCTVRSESISQQPDGGFRMTGVEFTLRLVDEILQRWLMVFRFCDDGWRFNRWRRNVHIVLHHGFLHVLLRGDHARSPLQLFLVEDSVTVRVVVRRFFQHSLGVRHARFVHGLREMFIFPRRGGCRTLDRQVWLHGLPGLTASSNVEQFRVIWVVGQRPGGHCAGTFGIAHPLQQHGQVRRGWCMVRFKVQTNRKRLLCSLCIPLALEQHASVVPCHGT